MTFKINSKKRIFNLYKEQNYITILIPENEYIVGQTYQIKEIYSMDNKGYDYLQMLWCYDYNTGTDENHVRYATQDEIYLYLSNKTKS